MTSHADYTLTLPFYQYYHSPVGWLKIQAADSGVAATEFCEEEGDGNRPNGLTEQTKRQLMEYFSGKRKAFDLPLAITGTGFQKKVWEELRHIPYGKTLSYLGLSRQIGNVKAIRAVGHANGQNPLAIIIPCHRVIGSDGSLTGYAGGLWRKKWLLEHEGALLQTSLPF